MAAVQHPWRVLESTRRGLQEATASQKPTQGDSAGRPTTRGKGYLSEQRTASMQMQLSAAGAVASAGRPGTRHGTAAEPQHLQLGAAAASVQSHHQSLQQGASHQQLPAAAAPSRSAAAPQSAAASAAATGLLEHPSQASFSVSDLDGLGSSSLSIEASSIESIDITGRGSKITTSNGSAAAPRSQQAAGHHSKGAANGSDTKQQQQQKQDQQQQQQIVQQIWQRQALPQKQQQQGQQRAHPAAKAIVEARASNVLLSELSGLSSSFLSAQGSSVEIVYSETDVGQQPQVPPQQQQLQQPGITLPRQQAATAATAATSAAVQQPIEPKAAGNRGSKATITIADNKPSSAGAPVADDSVLSGDIEFSTSGSSIVVGAGAAAGTSSAAAAGMSTKPPLPPSVRAAAAAATAAVAVVSPAVNRSRRAASTNLRWTGSDSAYGSAEIEFEPSQGLVAAPALPQTAATASTSAPPRTAVPAAAATTAAAAMPVPLQSTVAPTPAAAAAAAQARAQPARPAADAGPQRLPLAAQRAADATDQLFATLVAVPNTHHPDSSDDDASSSNGSEGYIGSGSRDADETLGKASHNGAVHQSSIRSSCSSSSKRSSRRSQKSSSHRNTGTTLSSSSSSRRLTAGTSTHELPQPAASPPPAATQPMHPQTEDLLSGLEQLHATLQLIRPRTSSSSSSSSSSDDDDQEDGSSSDKSSRGSSSSSRQHHSAKSSSMDVQQCLISGRNTAGSSSCSTTGNGSTPLVRQLQQAAVHGPGISVSGTSQAAAATPAEQCAAQAAAADAAAAEVDAMLGSLHVVQQGDLSSCSGNASVSSLGTSNVTVEYSTGSEPAMGAGVGVSAASAKRELCRQVTLSTGSSGSRPNQAAAAAAAAAQAVADASSSKVSSVDINELLCCQSTAIARIAGLCAGTSTDMDVKSHRAIGTAAAATAAAHQSRKRSVALQVGSSNDRATQVMFDERRQLLWDGGCWLSEQQQRHHHQQQQQRPGLGALSFVRQPNSSGCSQNSACTNLGLYGYSGAQQSAHNGLNLARGLGLDSNAAGLASAGGAPSYSCWSVLSASLQQFRAAALLDQLEALLRTAQQLPQVPSQMPYTSSIPTAAAGGGGAKVRHPGCSVTAAATPELSHRNPSAPGAPVAAGSNSAHSVVAHVSGNGNGAAIAPKPVINLGPSSGWFSIAVPGAASSSTVQAASEPTQETAELQDLQPDIQSAHPAAGWVTLPPALEQGATTAANPAPAVAALPPSTVKGAGWVSLPLPGSSSNSSNSNSSSSGGVEVVPATAVAPAADCGWVSLPMPGAKSSSPSAAQHEATAVAAAGEQWASLPLLAVNINSGGGMETAVVGGEAAAPRTRLATVTSAQHAGWDSLPLVGTREGNVAPSAQANLPPAQALGPAGPVLESRPPASGLQAAAVAEAAYVATADGAAEQVGWCSLAVPEKAAIAPVAATAAAQYQAGADDGAWVASQPLHQTTLSQVCHVADEGRDGIAARTTSQPALQGDFVAPSMFTAQQQQLLVQPVRPGGDGSQAVHSTACEPWPASSISKYASDPQTDAGAALSTASCSTSSVHTDAWEVAGSSNNSSTGRLLTHELEKDCSVAIAAAAAAADVEAAANPAECVAGPAADSARCKSCSAQSEALHGGSNQQQQQQQQQQQPEHTRTPSSSDTFTKYIAYLDAAAAQGVAPPGLTATTAQVLRQHLVQAAALTPTGFNSGVGQGIGSGLCGLPGPMCERGAGALCYEDMVVSNCLDSFVGSSLAHIRRKIGVSPIAARLAWGDSRFGEAVKPGMAAASGEVDRHKPVATLGMQALGMEGAAQDGASAGARARVQTAPGRQRSCTSSSGDRLTAMQRLHGDDYQYTTLQHTLAFIRQHRANGAFTVHAV